jgi:hypothetical protein
MNLKYKRVPQTWACTINNILLHFAEKLHNIYLEQRIKIATPQELKDLKQWNQLDEEFNESSRTYTDSIPHKLRPDFVFPGRETGISRFS